MLSRSDFLTAPFKKFRVRGTPGGNTHLKKSRYRSSICTGFKQFSAFFALRASLTGKISPPPLKTGALDYISPLAASSVSISENPVAMSPTCLAMSLRFRTRYGMLALLVHVLVRHETALLLLRIFPGTIRCRCSRIFLPGMKRRCCFRAPLPGTVRCRCSFMHLPGSKRYRCSCVSFPGTKQYRCSCMPQARNFAAALARPCPALNGAAALARSSPARNVSAALAVPCPA